MPSQGGTINISPKSIASRIVEEELQEQFAALSGDRNPIHMDRVAARRTQPGKPVVHGVHTLLWALESLVACGRIQSPPSQLKVKFLKWVYLGDKCELSTPHIDVVNPTHLRVDVLGLQVLSAELSYEDHDCAPPRNSMSPSPVAPLQTASNLSFGDFADLSGFAFTPGGEQVRRIFPKLSAILGTAAVGEITACSYVVGMEAPGLQSMFSKLQVTILTATPAEEPRAALHYVVTEHDERFHKARIAVTGQSVMGTLDVFFRTPPVEQASMQTVSARVSTLEFSGMNALIVGGSRGLGEVTAKIIAAGGGSPTITYALGKTEAENIAGQIIGWGGDACTLAYDVRRSPKDQLRFLRTTPTHVFYFATNQISQPKRDILSPTILEEFTKFYLHGFYELCCSLIATASQKPAVDAKLIVFYPSTVFIEERPPGMTEYAMVKTAGEQLCRDMSQYMPTLRVITARLPRLRTDQTAGVVPEKEIDPIDILLPIVREMKKLRHQT